MKKLKTEKGMSLGETLAAVLIVSLVMLTIAAGVTAGVRVYHKITERAEAQTLLATNVAALNEYLEKSDGIVTENNEINIKYSEVSQTEVRIYNNKNNGIFVEYKGTNVDTPLISKSANTSGLYAVLSTGADDGETPESNLTAQSDVNSYTITIYNKDGERTNETQTVDVRNTIHYAQ